MSCGEVLSGATRSRRARCSTDPQTCLEVYKSHWSQTFTIIKQGNTRIGGQVCPTEAEPVFHYLEQMMTLLIEEKVAIKSTSDPKVASSPLFQAQPGPILSYTLEQDVFNHLLAWSEYSTGDLSEELKLHQLIVYDQLISQMKQPLLHYPRVLGPILRLIQSCALRSSVAVERRYVIILYQICVWINRDPRVLQLCEQESAQMSAPTTTEALPTGEMEDDDSACRSLIVFSLLVPLVHREESGDVGRMARDALLLLLGLSSRDERVARFISAYSDFCPVLATGLSGLYSSLPRQLPCISEDWQQITQDNWSSLPDLVNFMHSLDFCNLAIKVSHKSIKDELLHYVYTGFLVPVVGSALHQNSLHEVVAATAYLDLFLRRLYEPGLIKIFLQFIITERYDDYVVLDSLITRLANNTMLGITTLSLFRTILNFHCEDVMYHLVFRYMIPCHHLVNNQVEYLRDIDPYTKSSDKFLSLIPSCCFLDTSVIQEAANNKTPTSSSRWFSQLSGKPRSSPGGSTTSTLSDTINLQSIQASYVDYLNEANSRIRQRVLACQGWKFAFDGEDPPPNIFDDETAPPIHNRLHQYTTGDSESFVEGDDGNTFSRYLCEKAIWNNRETELDRDPGESSGEEVSSCRLFTDDSEHTSSRQYQHRDSVASTTEPDVSEGLPLTRSLGNIASSSLYRLNYFEDEELVMAPDLVVQSDHLENEDAASILPKDPEPDNAIQNVVQASCMSDMGAFVEALDKVELAGSTEEGDGDIFTDMAKLLGEEASGDEEEVDDNEEGEDRYAGGEDEEDDQPGMGFPIIIGPLAKPPGYGIGSPTVGPFLTTLLCKLESMPSNSLFVNLLLTELLANLALYSQPLLKTFLLNTSLDLQPTVRSLHQVLSSVRQRLDSQSFQIEEFGTLLLQARQYLTSRINPASGHPTSGEPQEANGDSDKKGSKRRRSSVFMELFGGGSRSPKHKSSNTSTGNATLEPLNGLTGYRFRVTTSPHNLSSSTNCNGDLSMESIRVRNLVYAAVVLQEFCKELSAIAREHSIQPW